MDEIDELDRFTQYCKSNGILDSLAVFAIWHAKEEAEQELAKLKKEMASLQRHLYHSPDGIWHIKVSRRVEDLTNENRTS